MSAAMSGAVTVWRLVGHPVDSWTDRPARGPAMPPSNPRVEYRALPVAEFDALVRERDAAVAKCDDIARVLMREALKVGSITAERDAAVALLAERVESAYREGFTDCAREANVEAGWRYSAARKALDAAKTTKENP